MPPDPIGSLEGSHWWAACDDPQSWESKLPLHPCSEQQAGWIDRMNAMPTGNPLKEAIGGQPVVVPKVREADCHSTPVVHNKLIDKKGGECCAIRLPMTEGLDGTRACHCWPWVNLSLSEQWDRTTASCIVNSSLAQVFLCIGLG